MAPISRRKLFHSGVAAAVLMATGVAVEARPRGGTLRAGLSGAWSTDSWDSRTHAGAFMMAAAHGAVFDTLTEVAADGSLRGELATGWEASDGARQWVFNLRRNVRFHNGAPFTADDVIASILMHGGTLSGAAPIAESIARIDRLDDHQLRFVLHTGNADFPYLMSDYHLIIYPHADMQAAMERGIGTGLYRVERFTPGERMTAVRVNGHYKDGSAGYFDRLDFFGMNDAASQADALAQGRIDVADLAAEGADRIIQTVGNRHINFAMPTDMAPFDDAHVRKALKYGIDRHELLDTLAGGHGTIAADTPIGPANPYFDASLLPVGFDPDRARWHLAQAGVPNLTVEISGGAAARLYANSADRAGITINPALGADWAARDWSGRVTEDWMFSAGYMTGAPWNHSRWADERFDSLLLAARAELDTDLRREMYHEMQAILRDDGGAVIPMFADWRHGVSKRIGTPEVIGNLWHLDNARMAERWWMA